ncbi:Ldh family oxidoreductase, partial [Escherichia coli]|uniref:Ldh family oxidoreductase n=1 Tax=Escherichia coli TaxID=562 RepID=UPI001603069C
ATLCEVLGGALSGGQTTHQESLQTSVDAIFNCMTTVILCPYAFDAPDSQAQTEAFIAWCKQSPHDPDAPVLAPGEWEAANREARLAEGIPLDAGSWQAICAAARDVGLSESHIARCRPLA